MTTTKRSPVVTIMGHVDHGKSTLLDFIRSTNVVDGEAGGITQHLRAYEVTHKYEGEERKITFIDTPGHAAFSGMRTRGASIGDIAILIVSASDGVQEQTAEAIRMIRESNVPFVVAINKIDTSSSDPERVKNGLMEYEVFLEGYGGDVAYTEISAKVGTGVSELLDIVLLTADIEEFTGSEEKQAEGFVVESHLDQKRGNMALLIVKDGTLKRGQFVVAGTSVASTRIMEDFQKNNIDVATFSSPVRITGFDTLPEAGALFMSFDTKKEAEKAVVNSSLLLESQADARTTVSDEDKRKIIPVIIKTDVLGTKEAIESEINKITDTDVIIKIIKSDVGSVNSGDIKLACGDPETIIFTFHTSVEREARETPGFDKVTIKEFTVIYKLIEWLTKEKDSRRPLKKQDEVSGVAKILKIFSQSNKETTLGIEVTNGILNIGDTFRLIRDEANIAQGNILSIQQARSDKESISEGQAGIAVTIKGEPKQGDCLESFVVVVK